MKTYDQRISELEQEGLNTSDAQGVIEAEDKMTKATPWQLESGCSLVSHGDETPLFEIYAIGAGNPTAGYANNLETLASMKEVLERISNIGSGESQRIALGILRKIDGESL